MSRRMCIGSKQILCHCKRDFVLHWGGDTWTLPSLGYREVSLCTEWPSSSTGSPQTWQAEAGVAVYP